MPPSELSAADLGSLVPLSLGLWMSMLDVVLAGCEPGLLNSG